jgi:hypothetical protein
VRGIGALCDGDGALVKQSHHSRQFRSMPAQCAHFSSASNSRSGDDVVLLLLAPCSVRHCALATRGTGVGQKAPVGLRIPKFKKYASIRYGAKRPTVPAGTCHNEHNRYRGCKSRPLLPLFEVGPCPNSSRVGRRPGFVVVRNRSEAALARSDVPYECALIDGCRCEETIPCAGRSGHANHIRGKRRAWLCTRGARNTSETVAWSYAVRRASTSSGSAKI